MYSAGSQQSQAKEPLDRHLVQTTVTVTIHHTGWSDGRTDSSHGWPEIRHGNQQSVHRTQLDASAVSRVLKQLAVMAGMGLKQLVVLAVAG